MAFLPLTPEPVPAPVNRKQAHLLKDAQRTVPSTTTPASMSSETTSSTASTIKPSVRPPPLPSLAEAFFRTHWTRLSQLATKHDWYPTSSFQNTNSSQNHTSTATTTSHLLDPSKLPLLASAVRDIFYLYGPEHAWELLPHVYFDGLGNAKIAWSHADEKVLGGEVKKGILRRAEEVGLLADKVLLQTDCEGGFDEEIALLEDGDEDVDDKGGNDIGRAL